MVKGEVEESGGLNPHVKEGVYIGRLAGVRERMVDMPVLDADNKPVVPARKEKVKRWDWIFGVRTKEGDLRMTALTSTMFSTKSKAFSFAKGLKGEAIEVGENIDTDELVGSYGNLTMKDKNRTDRLGNVTVTSIIFDVMPLDKEQIPEKEIVIEGLVAAEEEPEPPEQEPEPTPPEAKPEPPKQPEPAKPAGKGNKPRK